MNTIGVVLLAAATATAGIGKPHAWKSWMRPHAVTHAPAPPGGPINAAMMGAGGADGAGYGAGRRFPNTRSQLFFVDPPGMRVGWQAAGGTGERIYLPGQLIVPARYNFTQGYIYRLKLTDIPGRPGLSLYPTIEVAPSTPATDAFLTHNPIPAQFTEEDFDQVTAGNFVTKVIYLPDPKYQELAISGVETLVSTRLEPGVDPILEADRRGTILMIVRMGAIDLEMPSVPGSTILGPSAGPMAVPLNGGPVYNNMPPVMQPVDSGAAQPMQLPGASESTTPPQPGVPGEEPAAPSAAPTEEMPAPAAAAPADEPMPPPATEEMPAPPAAPTAEPAPPAPATDLPAPVEAVPPPPPAF